MDRMYGRRVKAVEWIVGAALSALFVGGGPSRAVAQEAAPTTHAWVTAGGTLGTAGFGGILGASVERSGWSGSVRYHRATRPWSGRGPRVSRQTEEYAFLLGRRIESEESATDVALGLAYATRWNQETVACSDCAFGPDRLVRGELTSSPGLAFDVTVRRPDRGRFGAALQLFGTAARTGSYLNVALLFELGRLD